MIQLLQLQRLEEQFAGLNAVVLMVFREEQYGLHEIRKRLHADFILALDLGAKQTHSYGVGSPEFNTYIIDPEGVIRSVQSEVFEVSLKRPTGREILNRLREVSS